MGLRKRSWLTRREKVEIFEQIRREYEFGVGTIAGVSRKLGVHRRMVREALQSAEPAPTKPQQRRLRKLDAATDFIDQVLRSDVSAPPKQRHTAPEFLIDSRPSCPASAAVSVRFVATCSVGGSNWDWKTGKYSCHRRTRGARKRRW